MLYVRVFSVTMDIACREYVFFIIIAFLFLLKYGSLGENIFRGVWNKAQALVYVVFSVRVLLILM